MIDLTQAMGESAPLHPEAVHGYVRYGSTALVEKAMLGDQFAKLQAEKEGAAHRADVATKVFCLRGLPVVVPERDDFATKGLFLVCEVPLRLHVRNKQVGDERSGNIRQLHPCWANLADPWFLTKAGTLQKCRDLTEADQVVIRGDFLYFPDGGDTHLILNLAVPLDLAARIGQQPEKYTVDVVFDNVKPLPTVGWGYYRKDALEKNDWNAPKLFNWNLAGGANPGNVAAVPFFRPVNKPAPTHIHADLVALTFRERAGKAIASYSRKSAYGELQMPPDPAAAPPEVRPRPDIAAPKLPGARKFPLIRPKPRSRLKEMREKSGSR